MPQPGRAAVILLAVLAVCACDNGKRRLAEAKYADAAVSLPAPLLHVLHKDADSVVELTLQPHIADYPELHRALFDDEERQLSEFAATAKADRARFAQKGVHEPGPYERRVSWTIAAITPDLISLKGTWFDDTGGAHPNHGSDTRLWDRQRNQMLLQSDLFKPDYDFTNLDAVLCAAVRKTKEARMGPTDPKSWSCPKWADSHSVLTPSVRPFRAGGLTFLFDPYVIGAYAEGDYRVLIPLAEFQPAIAPAWAADFVGSPAPDQPKP